MFVFLFISWVHSGCSIPHSSLEEGNVPNRCPVGLVACLGVGENEHSAEDRRTNRTSKLVFVCVCVSESVDCVSFLGGTSLMVKITHACGATFRLPSLARTSRG